MTCKNKSCNNEAFLSDPYCSAECCRQDHDAWQLPPKGRSKKVAKYQRRAKVEKSKPEKPVLGIKEPDFPLDPNFTKADFFAALNKVAVKVDVSKKIPK